MIIEKINEPNDIKKIPGNQLKQLAKEIRTFLIESISRTGGHLSSNLGVVELTMALHLSFDLPKDKIIWDVGHQSYTHKILTGRKNGFEELRSFGGMSGFPKRKESVYDSFDTGHSSTAISAGLGIARARDIRHESFHVVSVVGDGSLTGGMCYEALNNASLEKTNFIIVLNDNKMSISENVGGVNNLLAKLRTSRRYNEIKDNVSTGLKKIPKLGEPMEYGIGAVKDSMKRLFVHGMFFEDMDITYLGPVNGHHLDSLLRVFNEAKKVQGPVLVHVITQKGKGYSPAEENPCRYHGVDCFDIATGAQEKKGTPPTYTSLFSSEMVRLGGKYPELIAITAAMKEGTGLVPFSETYPDRFFDVGIAEQHGVTFAAGLASQGMRPVVAIYSSFLQRAFDQIIHDVCIQNLPVIFAVDRAGLVGADGETHQGIFDLSFLSAIPNLTVFAPKDGGELQEAFRFALKQKGPMAIRYPRGEAPEMEEFTPIRMGKGEVLVREKGIALLAVGSMVETAMAVHDRLERDHIPSTVVNMRFINPWDQELVRSLLSDHGQVVTLEENVRNGGFGEKIGAALQEWSYRGKWTCISLPNAYVEHGNVQTLKKTLGLDTDAVWEKIIKDMQNEQ